MQTVVQDIRHAWRGLAQTPGFSAMAVATLGLGIAACTAIFSLLDAVLLRPLPYRDPDRLVAVHERLNGVPGLNLSAHEMAAWREQNDVFDGVAGYMFSALNLTGGGDPRMVRAFRGDRELLRCAGQLGGGRPDVSQRRRPKWRQIASSC